jgi:hypothetical protein
MADTGPVVLVVLRRADGYGVAFDATVSTQHQSRAVVTEFPVERGSNAADHVRQQPKRVTLSGIVGPTPLRPTTLGAGDLTRGFPEQDERAQRAFDVLENLQDDGELLQVITPFKTYSNMILESTVVTRDKDKTTILDASCTLLQIRTTESETINLPAPRLPRGQATKADGRRSGETVATPETRTSMALDAARSLTRLAGGDASLAGIIGGGE